VASKHAMKEWRTPRATAATQEDCMADHRNDTAIIDDDCDGFFSGDPPSPHCNYGCGRAHQAWMREEYGENATSADYYLQPLIDLPLSE